MIKVKQVLNCKARLATDAAYVYFIKEAEVIASNTITKIENISDKMLQIDIYNTIQHFTLM